MTEPNDSELLCTVIGIAWYRRADWDCLLRMFPDRETMYDSFDAWLRDAENTDRQMQNQGTSTERIVLGPDEFSAWCRAQGVLPNPASRSRYVAQKTRHKRQPANAA